MKQGDNIIMGKDLYGAPWSPHILQEVTADKAKNVGVDITVDEGREVVDGDGTPKAGYSAYGLCVKESKN